MYLPPNLVLISSNKEPVVGSLSPHGPGPKITTPMESQSRAVLPVVDDDTRVFTHGQSRRESREVQISLLYQCHECFWSRWL